MSNHSNAPLFRDPIYDGAADPTIIWNHLEKEWWMIYTNRRATAPGPKVSWVHGTDLGIASSKDGKAWTYRGVIKGLNIEKGRNTFWAPEVLYHDGLYHMYVSYIQGVPDDWPGHERNILHYTSKDLWDWTYESTLSLSSNYVIDAAVHKLPDGRWRMWYKDEANRSHTYAADSYDLYKWNVAGPVITGFSHEGVNVFEWKGWYWLIIDQWKGQGVYRSKDGESWKTNGIILDESGTRTDDTGYGFHADVLVYNDQAYIFYFTHPDRHKEKNEESYRFKRSSIQVAQLDIENDRLVCDRNKEITLDLTMK
ncbi:glycosyl hydrolase [Gracilibacillus sp. YIM 98692]|uniref:glycosyl hydrolase n=1 Tax=Gracilibacillus sp. YIM 98692 TaxID=2663532 RepID=UPI0013D29476|nr:glycosyl hydrolase [Gracilibacillus sp. YIM 98692]